MSYPPKIDLEELRQMLDKGMTQQEAAQYFHVSSGSVSKAAAKLKGNIIRGTTRGQIRKHIQQKIDAIEQLNKINAAALEMLDLLMSWQRGDPVALQVLESQMIERRVKVGDKEDSVREYRFKDPRDLVIRVMAEIRGQVALHLEIFKALYDMQAVQEFQEEVLDGIGEVAPDVRAKIIEKLNQRRAIRGAVTLTPASV